MEFKNSFSTCAGRDFEVFAKTAKSNLNTFFDYQNERARCDYVLENADSPQKTPLSFSAKFFSNKFHFCITTREFADLSKENKAATAKALVRLNANADVCDAGFITFSHRPHVGFSASIVVMYGNNNSLELMRNAFLSLWCAFLTHRDYLRAVAIGRERTREERIKEFRSAIGYFASFFTDVTNDYIWGYEPVKKIVQAVDEELNQDSWGDDDDYALDEEGFDGFLNGELDMHGDGFLWPKDENEDDGYDCCSPPEDDDESFGDGKLNLGDELSLNASFLRAVMVTAFCSKSPQRRKEDLPILKQSADSPRRKKRNGGEAEDQI